jgi:hypothetical protein
MKFHFAVVVFASVLCLAQVAAKPPKKAGLPPGDLFFTMKGQPYAMERNFPGITAALMLSDEQKQAIHDAQQQTTASPQMREKMAAVKDKNAGNEAERQVVRTEMAAARGELAQRVSTILTAEQKALVEKIQQAAMESQQEARGIFKDEFAASKGDAAKAAELKEKARVEAEDLLVQKLEKILRPEQMRAVQQAATEQRAAEELARNRKFGK